ncbi:hypothetical protein [Trichocoleus sp. FACHB-46]|uniref:Uncharacterized protein n=2 Tax=Trichocoleus TaxID=450526 RepID=A0ABV0JI88_9CYAN|nr:hypothetical protein [Trichocoleus sp. FACHB-46]MBD1865085.1 hypothetical protein [Trichocoleus sp. FACHB-46]
MLHLRRRFLPHNTTDTVYFCAIPNAFLPHLCRVTLRAIADPFRTK